ncbi:hypothetical protein N9X55_02980 [Flavobacteriaceae bacterium]|jgi:hypothetical protein|nr:hypothetical protein [Flavobacterium sp.]MDB2555686.1 hypothetical protein [Flavobacteriaceae bacterium]
MTEIKSVIQNDLSEGYSLSKKGVSYSELIQQLKEYFDEIPFKGENTFLNVPILVDPTQLKVFSRLSEVLNDVIKKIVLNYFNDKRIREIYQLDDELESILRLAESRPYQVGMYRPDFIFDKSGQLKICEIGCRYPINGWMLSYYTRQILNKLLLINDNNNGTLYEETSFVSAISNDLDSSKKLFYVHDLEKGSEAHQFFDEIKKQGFLVKDISLKELEITDGILTVNSEIATQFILEMDREELKTISQEILYGLIDSEECLNDVRTLILVHDKRILSVLYDEQIMLDYIEKEDYDFLKHFLIPSYTLDSEKIRNEVINSLSNWVLKKNSGGRGIGIYVKNDCTPETWNSVISKEWKNYMVQEYVDQKIFDLEQDDKIESINIVGILLFYNAQSFGPGIFRGSSQSVINVHNGGYILPSLISNLQ